MSPVSEEPGPGGDSALPTYEEAVGGMENGDYRPPEASAAPQGEAGESLLAAAAAAKPPVGGEEEEEASQSPPEGGWGWVVMLASMWCNGAVFGIQNSCGVLFKSMLAEFGDPSDKQLTFRTALSSAGAQRPHSKHCCHF
ncbi:UNVERIFIED_CONTAM: hypothetical protein K2H54_069707 [Gekko kuhli]